MPEQFVYADTIISYEVYGTGQDVVLLHGFGEDSHTWDNQVSFLQPYCRLIVPDLPGSGKSGLLLSPHKNKPVTIDDYAAAIKALLDKEAKAPVIMLGHSMGGYITLSFAEQHPEKIKSFGLVHSTAFADSEEKKAMRQKAIGVIEGYGAHAFLKNTIPNLFGKNFKETYPHKLQELIEAGQGFTKEALQQYYRAMLLRPDRTDILKGNRHPVLFVMGTEDTAAPMEDVLKQSILPDISYIHVLQGTGHMGMWEATDQLNQLLLAFIHS